MNFFLVLLGLEKDLSRWLFKMIIGRKVRVGIVYGVSEGGGVGGGEGICFFKENWRGVRIYIVWKKYICELYVI